MCGAGGSVDSSDGGAGDVGGDVDSAKDGDDEIVVLVIPRDSRC